jgi:hypothetical protein
MHAPLNDETRRIGGLMRDSRGEPWEKEFMGLLARSARTIKNDRPEASDAKAAVEMLKNESSRFPWSVLFLVCRDGNTVRSGLSDAEAVARVNACNGAIGLAGFLFLRGKFTTFVRPFLSVLTSPDVEQRLRDTVKKRWDEAQALIRENEEERSPARAKVFTDGKNAQIQYLWQDPVPAPEGWTIAGTLYAVPELERGGWVAKAHVAEERWLVVMQEAIPHFEAEVRRLIDLLNQAGGLGLKDLPELIKLSNNPRPGR